MDIAAVVRESIEVIWNRGELDRLAEFYADDFYWHPAATGRIHAPGSRLFAPAVAVPWVPGYAGVEQVVRQMRTIYPDYHEDPQLVIAEGDLVAVRQTVTGTHSGAGPFPATHRSFEVVDMMFCRVRDGKLAEQWGLFDQYSLITQLGLHEVADARSGTDG